MLSARAVFPWLVLGIACLFGARVGGDSRYYGFLCTVCLQIVIFRVDHLPNRDRRVFLTTLALVLIFASLGIIGLFLGDLMMVIVDPRISLTRGEASR